MFRLLSSDFCEGCQNCLLRVRRNEELGKTFGARPLFFSEIELKHFGPLVETFRQGCQNCNLSFKKTSPMKFVFCHCSPMNCWYWAGNFQPFGVKILAGFSKLHPTCPEEQWRGENTLSSNCFCYFRTFR